MKKFLTVLALVVSFSSVSFADEICGVLDSRIIGPHCVPGRICPRWRRLEFFVMPSDGRMIPLRSTNPAITQRFNELRGLQVCAQGKLNHDDFTVDSIALRPKRKR